MATLQQKLKSFGIPCNVTSVEDEAQIFTMENNNPRTKILITHPDHVKVDKIAGSKKHKQAVIHVSENSSTHEEVISCVKPNSWTLGTKTKKEIEEFVKRRMAEKVIDQKRTFIPGSTFNIVSSRAHKYNGSTRWVAEVTIEVTTPERTSYFLVGKDEKSTFICQLPEQANSVAEAHKVLRPKDISKNAIRVGEWFFDPVTDKELKSVLANIEYDWDHLIISQDNAWSCRTNTIDSETLDEYIDPSDVNSDNHQAQLVAYTNENTYVMGTITDTRKTHKDVFLNRWHRVVHNRELINDSDKWD